MRFHLSVLAILISVLTGGLGCDDPLLVCTNFPDDPICGGNHNPPDDDPPANEPDVTASRRPNSPNSQFVVAGRQQAILFNFDLQVRRQEPVRITRFVIQVSGNDVNAAESLTLTDYTGNRWENIQNHNGRFSIEGALNPENQDRWPWFSIAANISPEALLGSRFNICLVAVGWRGLESGLESETPIDNVCGHTHEVVELSPIDINRIDGLVNLEAGLENPELTCFDVSPNNGQDTIITEIAGDVDTQEGESLVDNVVLVIANDLVASSSTDEGDRHQFIFPMNERITAGDTRRICIHADGVVDEGLQYTNIERIRTINPVTRQVGEMLFSNDPAAPRPPNRHTYFNPSAQ